jgi:hypothetical protein
LSEFLDPYQSCAHEWVQLQPARWVGLWDGRTAWKYDEEELIALDRQQWPELTELIVARPELLVEFRDRVQRGEDVNTWQYDATLRYTYSPPDR